VKSVTGQLMAGPNARRWPGSAGLALRLAAAMAVAAMVADGAPAATFAAGSASGPVLAWGDDHNGQLGDGATTSSDTPVAVRLTAGTTVASVRAGGKYSLALTSAGQVLAWGGNFSGQLGDGTTTDRHAPVRVKVPQGTRVIAVSAGGAHSLAVTAAGAVLAWGDNEYGQLGDGTTKDRRLPVRVKLPAGTRVVAVGASYNYSLALTAAGRVWAWGHNGSGQLGDGTRTDSHVPIRVKLPGQARVTAIAAGGFDGLALTAAGHVLAWGDNGFGQLGNGTRRSSSIPVRVRFPAGTQVTAVGVGSLHNLALTSAGQVLAWGYNAFGQLGNGSTTGSDTPVRVKLPPRANVVAVSAGGGFSLALTRAGHILAWGHNQFGQLGDGTMVSSDTPVRVAIPAGLVASALAAGPTTRHSLAIVHHARRRRQGTRQWSRSGAGTARLQA
jgi:alpha-tubulin suppressor-like RCC1 family protein